MTTEFQTIQEEVLAAARSGASTAANTSSSPRAVIRGESPLTRGGAIVDWLRFSFIPDSPFSHCLEQLSKYFALWFDFPVFLKTAKVGFRGYQSSVEISAYLNGEFIKLGLVAMGGANVGGTMLVDITGTGCGVVSDWDSVYATMQDLDAKITRCDLAVDFLEGEYSIDQIDEMYFAGEFNSGGRIPKRRRIESGDSNQSCSGGVTVEIGRRVNGKMVRAYEKGRQLGNQDSKWLRIEVELHNRDRVIPHDIVLKRSEYFSGAHKALATFINAAAEKIKTQQVQHETSVEIMTGHMVTSYGKLIDQLMIKSDGDAEAVIKQIRIKGIPNRLQKTALAAHVSASHVQPDAINGNEVYIWKSKHEW